MMRMETIIHKVGRAIGWFSVQRCHTTGVSDTNKYIEERRTSE